MKSLSIILASVFLLFFTSAKPTNSREIKVGDISPVFKIKCEAKEVSLEELRGEYVLVNFWSSSDAQSRINNIFYDKMLKKAGNQFKLISINYDSDVVLSEKIIEIDGLETASQFNSEDVIIGDILSQWHLQNGSKAYLINREGKIEAINPDEEQLKKLI